MLVSMEATRTQGAQARDVRSSDVVQPDTYDEFDPIDELWDELALRSDEYAMAVSTGSETHPQTQEQPALPRHSGRARTANRELAPSAVTTDSADAFSSASSRRAHTEYESQQLCRYGRGRCHQRAQQRGPACDH